MMLQATDSISGVYGTTLLSWRRCVRHFSHMGTAFLAGAVSQRGPPQVNTMIAVQDRFGTCRALKVTRLDYSTSGGPFAALYCTAMELTVVEALSAWSDRPLPYARIEPGNVSDGLVAACT